MLEIVAWTLHMYMYQVWNNTRVNCLNFLKRNVHVIGLQFNVIITYQVTSICKQLIDSTVERKNIGARQAIAVSEDSTKWHKPQVTFIATQWEQQVLSDTAQWGNGLPKRSRKTLAT